MNQILFKSATIEMGKTVLKILKFLTLAIACSTWILIEAILRVSVSSSSDRCSLLQRKGGMLSEIPFGRSLSTSNPLSAITESPSSSNFKIPQSLVICLSLDLPAYKSHTKVTAADGVIPTRPLAVL